MSCELLFSILRANHLLIPFVKTLSNTPNRKESFDEASLYYNLKSSSRRHYIQKTLSNQDTSSPKTTHQDCMSRVRVLYAGLYHEMLTSQQVITKSSVNWPLLRTKRALNVFKRQSIRGSSHEDQTPVCSDLVFITFYAALFDYGDIVTSEATRNTPF